MFEFLTVPLLRSTPTRCPAGTAAGRRSDRPSIEWRPVEPLGHRLTACGVDLPTWARRGVGGDAGPARSAGVPSHAAPPLAAGEEAGGPATAGSRPARPGYPRKKSRAKARSLLTSASVASVTVVGTIDVPPRAAGLPWRPRSHEVVRSPGRSTAAESDASIDRRNGYRKPG